MKTWLKTIGIFIGVFASCLLIFAVCLFTYANTDHFRNILLKRINVSIAGHMTIAGHDISFLKGRIALEKPALKSRSGQRLVALDRLMVDVAFLPLLKRAIVIETMTLKNPDIRLSVDRDKRVDIIEAFQTTETEKAAPAPKKQGWPLVVIARQITITDGRFYLIDDVKNLEVDLNRITVQARADLFKKTGEIRLGVESTVLAFGERRLKIQPLALSLVRSEGRPMSVVVEAKTDFADIGLSGTAQPVLHGPELNLKLNFGCSLVELNQLLKLPLALTGKADGELSVAGDWRNPEADLRLAYHGGSLAGYRVDKLQARAGMKNRLVTIGRLDILAGSGEIGLAGQVGLQNVFPEGFGSARMDMDRLAYDIKAALKHIDMAWLGKGTDRFKGTIRAEAALKGEGVDAKKLAASGSVDLSLEHFFLKGMDHPTNMQIQASGNAEAGVIDLNRFTLAAAETRFDGNGTFDTTSSEIQGRLKAETEDIGSLLSLFSVNGGAGACTVKVDMSGPWRQPEVGIDIGGQEIRFRETRIGDVDLSANLDPSGRLNVADLNLSNQGTHVRGSGTIQLLKEGMQPHETMPLQARLQVTDGEVHDFVANQSVKGSFEGEIQLDGTVGSLGAVASLRGKALAYENIRLGEVDAEARFLNGELLFDRFQLRNPETRCLVSGGVRAFEPDSWTRLADPVLNLDVAGDAASIAGYMPDIQGSLTLDAHLEGPLSNLKGKGNIQANHLDIYGQGLEGISLDIELRENRLHVPVLKASLDSKNIVIGSGWIALDQGFSFEIFSKDLQLNSIRKIRELNSVEGAMDFRVRGEGNVKAPSIDGDIRIKEIQINQENMDDFNFRIDLADNQLSIKGHQTFELDLAYHLLEKNFNIDVIFSNTDMTPFFLTTGIKDFGGKLSGKVAAKGNTTSLKRSEAVLDISNLSLTYREEPFAGADSIRGNMKKQIFSLPEFQLNFLRSGVLRIKGEGNLDGSFDLSVDGEIPATAALFYLKNVANTEGDIRVRAAVKGSTAQADVLAEIVFQNVGCTLSQINSSFKGINGKIRLTPAQVTIENIAGSLDSGTFQVNGEVMLEKFRPQRVRMAMTARQMPILLPQTMDMRINADLTAEGTGENIKIEGDIILLEGLYYKKVKMNLLQNVKERKRAEGSALNRAGHPFLESVSVDINLRYREPFIVDNNIAYLEIQPDLLVSGTLAAPVISGIAKVQEGTLTYQQKSFVVDRGIISFVNPYRIEPEIDIAGSIKIRKWLISLEINGSPDRLIVELSSTPPEEDADIISLLVFGKTTGEIRGGEEGAVTSNEALLALLMASSFGEDIKKSTGLDYLEVEAAPAEAEVQTDTVKVTVGKDLTARLSVKYTIGSGSSGYDQRATSEYKLLENILLSGFQDIKGSYGGEIIFRLEFR